MIAWLRRLVERKRLPSPPPPSPELDDWFESLEHEPVVEI